MRKSTILVGLCLVFAASSALAGTWSDDFEDPAFTEKSWEIKQGDWEIKDGWWQANSPAIGSGCFAILPNIETHEGLTMEVTMRDQGGGWSNGYIIFAYVDDAAVYYAGARIGRSNWSTEKSALAGGEQNFLEVADPRIAAGGVILPRCRVVIEGDDVVIYAEEEPDNGKWEEMSRVPMPAGMPIGPIGLAAENTVNDFDDFVVSGPEVEGKVAVKPAGKLATTWARIKGQF